MAVRMSSKGVSRMLRGETMHCVFSGAASPRDAIKLSVMLKKLLASTQPLLRAIASKSRIHVIALSGSLNSSGPRLARDAIVV